MSDSVGYLKGPGRVTPSDCITLLGETGGKHGMPDSAGLHDQAGQPNSGSSTPSSAVPEGRVRGFDGARLDCELLEVVKWLVLPRVRR